MKSESKIDVWQCGGGTQSACIAALICKGDLPVPAFSIIADTGYERSTTWAYMDEVLVPNLKKAGVNLLRVKAADYAYSHDGLFNNKGTLLVPAFSTQNEIGSNGKMSNFCTSYWKRDVVENFLRREHGLSKKDARKWIGFSIDEVRRAVRMMATEDYKAGLILFPLIDRFLRRAQSIGIVLSMGWPKPPRSNCYLCPNQDDSEWLSLTPEEFTLAVQWERVVRERDPEAFFHSSRVPLDQVVFNRDRDAIPVGCDSGACFL